MAPKSELSPAQADFCCGWVESPICRLNSQNKDQATNSHGDICPCNICPAENTLSFWTHNFFEPKLFLNQLFDFRLDFFNRNFFYPDIFLTEIFFI